MITAPEYEGLARGFREGRSFGPRVAAATLVLAAASHMACGGRVAETGAARDGGSGAAPDVASGSEDASLSGSADAGAAEACTTPGIYVVTMQDWEHYSLGVFSPTTLNLGIIGSLAIPPAAPCQGVPPASVAVMRSGQTILTCGGFIIPLDESLAPMSPIYEWPRVAGEPSGYVAVTPIGESDGGERLVGLGPPIGLEEINFDASFPAGTISTLDVEMLRVSGAVVPDGGPLAPEEQPMEGTGDGRAFALWIRTLDDGGVFPFISQVDPATGNVLAWVDAATSWDDLARPFAFWAGDFYTFPPAPDAGAGTQTDVVRLHPGTVLRETVGVIDAAVIAASTSPCAPTE